MKLKIGELYKFKNLEACHNSAVFYCMCKLGSYTFSDLMDSIISEKTTMLFLGYQKHNCEEDILSMDVELALFLFNDKTVYFRTFHEDEIFRFKNYITSNIYDNLLKKKQINIEKLVSQIS